MEERSCVQAGEKTEPPKNHWVICAKCFRPELTQFPVELFLHRAGSPHGVKCWYKRCRCATYKRFIRKIHVTRPWFLCHLILNMLSRQLISKWSLYCLGLLWCSMTFRIPLQATVQSRKIYVKCFLLESPSGQYSSCLVKYQDIHRTQVLMQIIRHKWPQ